MAEIHHLGQNKKLAKQPRRLSSASVEPLRVLTQHTLAEEALP